MSERTIDNPTGLWQEVVNCAYLMDGESRAYAVRCLQDLREYRPDSLKTGDLGDFAIYAVWDLLDSVLRNLIIPDELRCRKNAARSSFRRTVSQAWSARPGRQMSG
jgi:hypothetical protein